MTTVLNIQFNAATVRFMKTTLRASGSLQEARGHIELGRGGLSNRGKHVTNFEKNNNINKRF